MSRGAAAKDVPVDTYEPIRPGKGEASPCPFTLKALAETYDATHKSSNLMGIITPANFQQYRRDLCRLFKNDAKFADAVRQRWTETKRGVGRGIPRGMRVSDAQLANNLAKSPSLEIDTNVPYTLAALHTAYAYVHRANNAAPLRELELRARTSGAPDVINPVLLRIALTQRLTQEPAFRRRLTVYHSPVEPSAPRRDTSTTAGTTALQRSLSDSSGWSDFLAGGDSQSEYFGTKGKKRAALLSKTLSKEPLYPPFPSKLANPESRKHIRILENWGEVSIPKKLDILSSQFDERQFGVNWEKLSPKYAELIRRIDEQDAADLKTHGHLFKHVIYTDVMTKHGAPTIAACMQSSGFRIMKYVPGADAVGRCKNKNGEYNLQLADLSPKKLEYFGGEDDNSSSSVSQGSKKSDRGAASSEGGRRRRANDPTSYRIAVLSSTPLRGPRFFGKDALRCAETTNDSDWKAALTDAITSKFNSKTNLHGEDVRFVVIDSGFKEGISFKDTVHMWLCEVPRSRSALDQAMGRVSRFCGSERLPFDPYWKVYIHMLYGVVDVEGKDSKGRPKIQQQCLYQWSVSEEDRKSAEFDSKLLGVMADASFDAVLNKSLKDPPNIPGGWKNPMKLYGDFFHIP